jgi:hypothetical protein
LFSQAGFRTNIGTGPLGIAISEGLLPYRKRDFDGQWASVVIASYGTNEFPHFPGTPFASTNGFLVPIVESFAPEAVHLGIRHALIQIGVPTDIDTPSLDFLKPDLWEIWVLPKTN